MRTQKCVSKPILKVMRLEFVEDLKLLQRPHAYFQSFPLNPKRSFFTLQFTNPNFSFRKSTHGLPCQNSHAKIAIYHCLKKYIWIYHCLRNILQSTTFLKLDFFETWFCENQVPWTRVTSKNFKIFSWYSSSMKNSIFTKSSFKKVIDC